MEHQMLNANTDALIAAQVALEEEALGLGIEKYRERIAGNLEELPPGLRLLKAAIEPVAERINQDIETALSGTPGRSTGLYYMLSSFEAEMLAYVSVKAAISAMGVRGTQTATAMSIAQMLEDTMNFEKLKAEAPKLYKKLQDKIAKSTHAGYRHIVLKKQQKYAEVKTITWENMDRLRLGVYLLQVVENTTGLFTLEAGASENKKKSVTHKETKAIVPTEATMKWLEESHARCELLHPVHMPMLCTPADWTNPFNGGFLTKSLKFPLLKTGNKVYLEELNDVEMPMVYSAVNALQRTRWTINQPIYDVMQEVWMSGGKLGKLPSSRDVKEELPARGADLIDDEEALKAWKAEAAAVYEDFARNRSKRVMVAQRLAMAHKFMQYDSFSFAYALDWRGRAYPVSSLINPQGDDASKALLMFARGVPLGEEGAYWLAVHGANCFGVKGSFDERVQWISDNEELILDSAANPLDGNRLWSSGECDSPFMFLAFCKEWLSLHVHCYSLGNNQEDFVSHLPISFDGSCNGLQNFSAMLRDSIGGAATGLVPSDRPADIYSLVASVAQKQIDKEAAEGSAQAQRWVGRMTRKLTKRNTMTKPYSVSQFGMREQLKEEFKKIIQDAKDGGFDVRADYTFEDAAYLAEKNDAAINEVVVAAAQAMEWLKNAAKIAASNELPIYWTTPSGLRVLQNYRVIEGKQADFTVGGERVRLRLTWTGDRLDSRKMAAGVAANFVHSCDSAHLMRTVMYCVEEGLEDFAMIHDSYGTHAGNAGILRKQLVEAFIDQYTPNVLERFRDELLEQLPPELAAQLPELPKMGDLDLEEIRHSEYFFA